MVNYACTFRQSSALNFVRDLYSWDIINTSLTVDEAWTSFKDIFVTIADRHAPTHTRRVRSNKLPRMTDQIRALIGPLQVAIHVVQNRRTGEQKSHWDKTNKGNYHLKLCMPFVCLVPVRLLLTSTAVLYHVNGYLQRAYYPTKLSSQKGTKD